MFGQLARLRGVGLERYVSAYTLSSLIELTPQRLLEIFTESRGEVAVPAKAPSMDPVPAQAPSVPDNVTPT